MGLAILTPPTDYPVTLDEAKAQLNVVDSDDDDLITALIAAATQAMDGPFGWLGRALMPQTWQYFRDSFPTSTTWCRSTCSWSALNCDGIELPLPPLVSVSAVEYADPDNPTSYITMPASDYAVDTAGLVGWVQPVDQWPTPATGINTIRITFVAGYASVPASIKQAILMLVRDYYDQRGSFITGTIASVEFPFAVTSLITPYKVYPV